MSKELYAEEWLEKFEKLDKDFIAYLMTIYGQEEDLIHRKREKYLKVIEAFIQKYGNKKVHISRAPGRVNLMGRHIEHRGGNINTIAIHKETIMVAAKREDDLIRISNVDSAFSDKSFSIKEQLDLFHTENWISYIESEPVIQEVKEHQGNWVHYVKAAVLRFQFENLHRKLYGMDMMCLGTVPIAGGVSSSSSIVMGVAELIAEFNQLAYEKDKFIRLCGESEWYVGSRGGAGDHAAIKCGSSDAISPIQFEPIRFNEPIEISSNYSVIVANSFIEAKKSDGAKDKFNQMVASYEFGVMIFKDTFPEYTEKIVHLRDINPKNLQVENATFYRMLATIPLKLKPEELFEKISKPNHEKIERILKTHQAPEFYSVRSAVIFGIAECERSRICPVFLKEGKYEEFGNLMKISHDGDRVVKLQGDQVVSFDYQVTDEKLESLIELSKCNAIEAELYHQPGGYACSVEEIDILIDRINSLKGVLGSQISGAGLGGCIMILCESKYKEEILKFLSDYYYKPRNLNDGAIVVKPIQGSMCLNI